MAKNVKVLVIAALIVIMYIMATSWFTMINQLRECMQ